jgi:hypothetical protein
MQLLLITFYPGSKHTLGRLLLRLRVFRDVGSLERRINSVNAVGFQRQWNEIYNITHQPCSREFMVGQASGQAY